MPPLTRARRLLLLPAALLLLPGPARAMSSSSADFINMLSALNSGGRRKNSPSFRLDGSMGSLAQTAEYSQSYRGRDGLLTGYYFPASVTLLTSSVSAGGTEALQWISPGNDGNEHSKPGGYIVRYSSIAAQAPSLSDAAFDAAANATPAPPAAVVQGTTVTMIVTGLTPGVVYYFAMKSYERDGRRSTLSKTVQYANVPQEVYGVAMATTPASVSLRWMAAARYADGVAFSGVSPMPAVELTGYHVYRATAPVLAPWTDVADLSTATLNWTDVSGGPGCQFQCFYYVAASNTSGLSVPSVVRGGDRSAYVVAPDGASYFEITSANVAPVEGVPGQPDSAYLITASSLLGDLGTLNGKVVKSIEFDAYQGGVLLAPNLPIPGQGILHLAYAVAATGSQVVPASVSGTPGNMSVYWNNGASWVQLYGTLDSYDQAMTIRTTYVGQYQLRMVERTGGFSFNMSGVSNRFLTPNGDHRNDNVVFTFDNPQDSAVAIKILDMRGRLVASNLPSGPISGTQVWDGRSNGRAVPGGVYIYQVQAEGRTYSGTLVVIR